MAVNFLRYSVSFACSCLCVKLPVCMPGMLALILEFVGRIMGLEWSGECLAASLSVGDCWLPGSVLSREYMLLLSSA